MQILPLLAAVFIVKGVFAQDAPPSLQLGVTECGTCNFFIIRKKNYCHVMTDL